MLFNIGYTHLSPVLALPWAVLPVPACAWAGADGAGGLTLAILDMYPQQRGSASSSQAFTQLLVNAVIGGVVSPWLSHSGAMLAVGAATLVLLAWLCWFFECRARRAMLAAAS
jgi:DHA1 family bicyclomycin/chloramphenicol resistance-like MFS transporter